MSKFFASLIVVFALAGTASAQPLPAASRPATLADVAMPSPLLVNGTPGCIMTLAQVMETKAATKACLEIQDRESERSERTAKQAANAAKKAAEASNPCIMGWLSRPSWCNGAYYGSSYGYGGGGGFVQQYNPPTRRAEPTRRESPPRRGETTGYAIPRGTGGGN